MNKLLKVLPVPTRKELLMTIRWLSSLPVILALAVSVTPARAQLGGQTVTLAVAGPVSYAHLTLPTKA